MATVNGLTAEAMTAIKNGTVLSATIDGSGHLIFTRADGTTFDSGAVFASIPSATTSIPGITQLATSAETTAGTVANKAVTPQGIAAVVGTFTDLVNTMQPKDSDLTTIAGLTAADDDIIQHKGGAWVNRTIAQLLADLVLAGAVPNYSYNGSTYALSTGAITYIGNTDPGGSAADGSVWFDTTGA
jgi:hypothetical protein